MAGDSGTMATTGGKQVIRHGVLPRQKRKQLFGIDCTDTLEWRNWQPGTEHTMGLALKNVSTAGIKLRYKQTASKAFSMEFPDPIMLRPGMSCSLKVTFRPLKMQQYSDHLEIIVNDASSFIVLVEAYTPAVHVQVPPSLDFGFVPCKELQQQQLAVRNTGDIQVSVQWKLDAPFSITPDSATVAPGATATHTVSFLPQEAGSFIAQATCILSNGSSCVCKVSGVAKFPYLSLEQPSVDFGEVVVGRTAERTLRFGNHSAVTANYSFTSDSDSEGGPPDGVFSLTPSRGSLGPDEFSVLRVVYTPKHTGTFSCESFQLATAGGNRVQLRLAGTAAAPKVTFSTRAFNWGNVPCGTSPTRVLYMQNHSTVPVAYDFQIDALDCFSISKPRGVLAPGLTGHVTLTFATTAPANYWRRVVCLLQDADPVGIDLLATAYDAKSRPPPLEHKHVAAYLNRVAEGGAPVQVVGGESVAPSPVPSYHSGQRPGSPVLDPGAGDGSGGHLAAAALAVQMLPGPDGWQLLFDGQDPAKAVTLDTGLLEFGTCSRLTASEYQSVVVTNNTAAKVAVFIVAPLWQDPAGGPPHAVFQALPESADLKPGGGQATFRVAFRPPKDAVHYAQTLVVCGQVKSQRNFRLVLDSQVVPPWSLPLQVCGNTFLHINPEFSPKVEVSHRVVHFPPCRPHEEVCQLLMLNNYGDTPAAFAFANTRALAAHFTIRPTRGVLAPGSHALVALRFRPTSTKQVSTTALLVLNGAALSTIEIALRGAGHTPRLTLDMGAPAAGGAAARVPALFFRPTCVGASSQRGVVLHNPTRVPVAWQWQLPAKLEGAVAVVPVGGQLRGKESVTLTWSFHPTKQRTYEARAVCAILPSPGTTGDGNAEAAAHLASVSSDDLVVRVVGEATGAALALDPPSLDFGHVKVGYPVKRQVRLVNQSDGVLRYTLDCSTATGSEAGVPADSSPEAGACAIELVRAGVVAAQVLPLALWVDEPEGTLPARASKSVTVTLFPRHRKQYSLLLRCRAATVPVSRPPSGSGPGALRLPPLGTATQAVPGLLDVTSGVSGTAAGPAAGPGDALGSVSAGAPVLCPVAAVATFPALLVTDVSLEGLSKPVAWCQLQLAHMNRELCSSISTAEVEVAGREERGTLTTEAACAALAPCPLDLGCLPLGGPPVVLRLVLSNRGPVEVAWQVASYDDPDLEMENWVQPGQPRNEAERARDFITEHHLLQLQPRRGELPARTGCMLLSVAYHPRFVGVHELPMFLHVADGKRLQLLLRGTTVLPPVQRLLLPGPPLLPHTPSQHPALPDRDSALIELLALVQRGQPKDGRSRGPGWGLFVLPATPLGCPHPPVHMQLLRNGGPGTVQYQVDVGPLQQQCEEHHGQQVFSLVGPAAGEVPEGGAGVLGWRFEPLEARVYTLQVAVQLGDGSSETLTLIGRGYHPAAPLVPLPLPGEGTGEWAGWQGFSPSPSAELAASRLVLPSQDTLSLGTTLPGGLVRRVLVLTNTSTWPVVFQWELGPLAPHTGALQGGTLAILPPQGRLEAGERVLVQLVLTAPLVPLLIDAHVECITQVDEETVMAAVAEAQAAAAEAEAAGALEVTDTGSVVEETLARHPARPGPPRPRPKARIPTHLGMTTAALAKFGTLREQWGQLMSSMRDAEDNSIAVPSLPPPERLHIALRGQVLTRAHLTPPAAPLAAPPPPAGEEGNSGAGGQQQEVSPLQLPLGVPLSEAPEALAVQGGAGEVWVPPTLLPFFLQPAVQAEAEEAIQAYLAGSSDSSDVATAQAGTAQDDMQGQGWQGAQGSIIAGPAAWFLLNPSAARDAEPWNPLHQPLMHSQEDLNVTFAGGMALGSLPSTATWPAAALSPVAESRQEQEPSSPPAMAAGAAAEGAIGGDAVQDQVQLEQQQQQALLLARLPQVPAPALPTGKGPSPLQAAHTAAEQLLQALLSEVMQGYNPEHPEVAQALLCLPQQPLPAQVQLLPALPALVTQGGGLVGSAPAQVQLLQDPCSQPPQPEGAASALAAADSQAGRQSAPAGDGVAGAQQGVGEQVPEVAVGVQAEGTDLAGVLQDPAFLEFGEWVASQLLQSLLEESVAGEWEQPNEATA